MGLKVLKIKANQENLKVFFIMKAGYFFLKIFHKIFHKMEHP